MHNSKGLATLHFPQCERLSRADTYLPVEMSNDSFRKYSSTHLRQAMSLYWSLLVLLILSLLDQSHCLTSPVFHITEVLGTGAFGTVFRAHLHGIINEFALKLPLPSDEVSSDSINETDFPLEHELKVLNHLDKKVRGAEQRRSLSLLSSGFQHPLRLDFTHLQSAQSSLRTDSIRFSTRSNCRDTKALVFPLYEGGHLHSLLEKVEFGQHRPLTDSEICSLALGIVQALYVLHGVGYVHLDLKPNNIMLDTSRPMPDSDLGRPVLIDFGLARKIGSKASCGGSIGYIAPELTHASNRYQCSGAEDVFSLGSVLKQLKSRRKFSSFQLEDMQEELWNNRHPDRDIVSRCWRKDPRQRPTLDEIKEKLPFEFCQLQSNRRKNHHMFIPQVRYYCFPF